MAKVKMATCAAGTAINRRTVMAIGSGMMKSNNPILLKENQGLLQQTEVTLLTLKLLKPFLLKVSTTNVR